MENILNNLIQQLKPEKGEMIFVLDKQKMIEGKKKEENYMGLKTKNINFFITNLIENKFLVKFGSIYISYVVCEFSWKKEEKEKEIRVTWEKEKICFFDGRNIIKEEEFSPKFPGGTIEILLCVNKKINESIKEQYILDIGNENDLSKERISLFVDERYNLNFRIIDLEGKIFLIKQKISKNWTLEELHKIKISWDEKIIKMRIYKGIEENSTFDEVINNKLKNIKLFYFPVTPRLVIGTDLKKEKFCKMSLAKLKIFSVSKF